MFKSGIIVAFFTLLSRFFGLARELFIAYTFGTTPIADCVNVAFKFPNLFRRIFGEGALSSVFIPIFSQKLVISRQEAKNFAGNVFVLLLAILIILTILLELTMPYLMAIIAPGFYINQDKFELAVILCRITTPYLIFLSITAIFGGMLNAVGKFWALAFVPILMSMIVVIYTYFMQDLYTAHYSIAYSLIIAGIIQILFMIFCLRRARLLFPLRYDKNDNSVIELLGKMGPAVVSSGAQQLNLFISHSIASFVPGAISVLGYADRLYQLPMALIGITFGTILLPELSKLYQKKDFRQVNIVQNKSIQIALLLSIPATFGLASMSESIIHLMYERGEFLRSDTIITAQSLSAFAFGLPAFTLAKIITPIYYANLDTKTPLRITLYSLIINTALNIALMIPFGIVGIAAGSSIAAWINVWLLIKYARQYGNFNIHESTQKFVVKIIISAFMMLLFIYIADYYYQDLFFSPKISVKLFSVCGVIAISAVIYILSCLCFKLHKAIYE